jgi:Mn2+/Fe2+ NRAMP family transporter
MLIAVLNKKSFGDYRHPLWMQIMGWVIVALMSWMSYITIRDGITPLLKSL